MDKVTVSSIIKKKGKEKITAITAYDAIFSRIEDEVGFDIILVGDSAGTTLLGETNTLKVTMDDMIVFAKGVSKGAKKALLVGDMPFLSYKISKENALLNAGRFIQEAGMDAVKLEGGKKIAETVKFLVDAGVPVMGHIGLTPQSILTFGGYKVQGKNKEEQERLIEDAKILEENGIFSLVLEGIPEELAKRITENVRIPTIGIGAGKFCDGQIIVLWDILGLTPPPLPKFIKRYANIEQEVKKALNQYKNEVLEGKYPGKEHTY